MPQITAAVVGTKYRGPEALQAISVMEPGSRVRLEREGDNQYDSNAVQVWFLGFHVGFISRKANPALAAAMDQGAEPVAEVRVTPIVRGSRIEIEPLLTISWAHPSLKEDRRERATEPSR